MGGANQTSCEPPFPSCNCTMAALARSYQKFLRVAPQAPAIARQMSGGHDGGYQVWKKSPPGSAKSEFNSSELRFPERWIPPGKARREFNSSEFLFPDLCIPPGSANKELRSSEFLFPDLWIPPGNANREFKSSEFRLSGLSTMSSISSSSCISAGAA